MKVRACLPLAFLWLCVPVVRPDDATISGQVFIVTKGAQNVKLALVHIWAIPEKTFAEFRAKKRAAAEPLKEPLEKISSKTADPDRNIAVIAHRMYLLSETYLFEGLPVPVAEAVTDADGKFTFALPLGRYVICAKSSRFVGDQREFYFWRESVSLDQGKPVQLMLSNENLTGNISIERRVIENVIGGLPSVAAFIDEAVVAQKRDEARAEMEKRQNEETKRREIDDKIKRRVENHARAIAKIKADWRVPAMRFSKLGDVDDEFTICRELNGGLWESHGVAQSVPRPGENPERFPWIMVYRVHSDGSVYPVFSQFGNRQTGDVSFIPH